MDRYVYCVKLFWGSVSFIFSEPCQQPGKTPIKKKSESLCLTCLETAGEPPNPYLCHMTYVFEPHSGAVFLNETSIPYLYKNI